MPSSRKEAEMPNAQKEQSLKRVMQLPVYWFSRFETATLKDNYDEAREAQQRLEILGFVVSSLADSRVKGGA